MHEGKKRKLNRIEIGSNRLLCQLFTSKKCGIKGAKKFFLPIQKPGKKDDDSDDNNVLKTKDVDRNGSDIKID